MKCDAVAALGPGEGSLKTICGDGMNLVQKLIFIPMPLPRLEPAREGWSKNEVPPDAAGAFSANFEG